MIVGVGFDLFEVARLERELEHDGGEFVAAVFTSEELLRSGTARRRARRLAACFAGKEAVAKAPEAPSYHYRLGLAFLKNNDWTRARQSLERAIKINPDFPEAQEARKALASIPG